MAISQKQFDALVGSTARLNFFCGPVRSGKTHTANHRFVEFVEEHGPKQRDPFLLSGKTFTSVLQNCVKPMMYAYPGCARVRNQRLYLFNHECEVVGFNNESAADRIAGRTYSGWLGDEVTLYPESVFNMAMSRGSTKSFNAFLTLNPASPHHYIKRNFKDNKKLRKGGFLTWWDFVLTDNPSLAPSFIEALHAMYHGVWYKRYILGDWAAAEGIIFDMWDEANELKAWSGKPDRCFIGVDHGVRAPCVFGKYFTRGKNITRVEGYRWDSVEEGRTKTNSEYGDDMVAFIGEDIEMCEAIIVDPSALSFIAELEARGLPVQAADNDVDKGLQNMADLIQSRQFRCVVPNCADWLKEMEEYQWDPKAQLLGIDRPLKKNDHGPDESRYAINYWMGEGDREAPSARTPYDPVIEAQYEGVVRDLGADHILPARMFGQIS